MLLPCVFLNIDFTSALISDIIYLKYIQQEVWEVSEEMTDKELITVAINQYMNLQRIKEENGGHKNKELDYQIKGLAAQLSYYGINVEDITL